MLRPRSPRNASSHASPYREPLFDLLAEDVPQALGVRSDRRRDLLHSIRREIAALLNTRRSNPDLLDPATATTLDYGIPNFSFRSADAPLQLNSLALILANAIHIFEPRLIGPAVTVERLVGERTLAVARISGSVRLGAAIERFSFPLAIDEQTMMTEMPELEEE